MTTPLRISLQRQIAWIAGLCVIGAFLSACGLAEASPEEIEAQWSVSAHADVESRSFTRWNDNDPVEIPTNCAKCHSTTGYRDFLGDLPGTTAGRVDNPAPVGTTIECEACHNDVADEKDSVVVPSGAKLEGMGSSSNCMECHQGRASKVAVNEAIGDKPLDTVDTELSMPNIHNNPAGSTHYGTEAMGGYEYSDQQYLEKYNHGFDTCATCHEPHTLEVPVANCSACHLGVKSAEDLPDIRLTNIDYDGDGDIEEGLSGEIGTIHRRLLITIRLYAAGTEGAANIDYDGRWVDENGESYTTWTPRMLQAAYNYQYVDKDVGDYAHHAKYVIQLLINSLEDLGGDTRGMIRPN